MEFIHLEKQRRLGKKDQMQNTCSSLGSTVCSNKSCQYTRRRGVALLLFLVIKALRTNKPSNLATERMFSTQVK